MSSGANKFKVGDRVAIKSLGSLWNRQRDGIIVKDDGSNCYRYRVRFSTTNDNQIFEGIELIKIGEPMNKYEDLKQRIAELDDGWNKEADDVLQEIYNNDKEKENIWIEICIDKNDIVRIKDSNDKVIKKFPYDSQCSKMTAFKQALMWLLDHSDIKKEDKSELKAEIKELRNKLEKLEERL